MHVEAKKVATAGVLAALSVVLLCLASVIEMSSLFLVAAASFCVGIAIREWGIRYGTAFFIACIAVGLLIAPNKMYCITFAGMAIYLIGSELIWRFIAERKQMSHRQMWFWIGKYVLFNIMYVPVLILFPKLLIAGKINGLFFVGLILTGQVALFFYDIAHTYIQTVLWGKFKRLKKL